jgi:hypothetical protein
MNELHLKTTQVVHAATGHIRQVKSASGTAATVRTTPSPAPSMLHPSLLPLLLLLAAASLWLHKRHQHEGSGQEHGPTHQLGPA